MILGILPHNIYKLRGQLSASNHGGVAVWPGSQVENLPSKPSTWNSSSPANPPHSFLKIKGFFCGWHGST